LKRIKRNILKYNYFVNTLEVFSGGIADCNCFNETKMCKITTPHYAPDYHSYSVSRLSK